VNMKAEEKAKKEAEREAKEAAKREAKEAKEREKREAQEAKEREKREAQEAKEREKREAQEAKEREKREAQEAKIAEQAEEAGVEIYEGIVKLAIASPANYEQIKKFSEYLRQVQDLRLILVGGSVEEGNKIVISAEKPIHLVNALREMPPVEQVVMKGKEIQVTLKAKQ
jgi:hypothetical protein